jgi:hypothetical protein
VRALETARVAEHVCFPTAFDDAPIRAVAIHGRRLTAAARTDAVVAIGLSIGSS